MDRWQNNIRHLRQFLRGWAKHEGGRYNKEKERLLNLINELDVKAEPALLDDNERTSRAEAEQSLRQLLREEELKCALRAKVRHVVQGDENTQYFHLIANGKRRKKENPT